MKKVILLSCLFFFMSTLPSLSAEPKAILSGPASVQSGTDIVLHFTGSITDSLTYLKVQSAPVDPLSVSCSLAYIKDQSGKYGSPFGVCRASVPGTYTFLFVVSGTPAGSDLPAFDSASLSVQVVAPVPPPVPPNPGPDPDPTPGPTPPPVPTPGPGPLSGTVWAVAVFPSNMTMELSPLLLGVSIRKAASDASINYRVLYDSSPEISKKNLTYHIANIKLPALIIQQADGTVVGKPLEMTTEDQVAAYLHSLRGK